MKVKSILLNLNPDGSASLDYFKSKEIYEGESDDGDTVVIISGFKRLKLTPKIINKYIQKLEEVQDAILEGEIENEI